MIGQVTDDDLEPPKFDATASRLTEVTSAGFNLIPAVGPIAEAMVFGALRIAGERQQAAWQAAITRKVREVAERRPGLTVDEIVSDASFFAALQRVTRAAYEDANEEKRRYLLNAAGNSGSWGEEPELVRRRFLEITANYTPLHVYLLLYFQDPAGWHQRHDRPVNLMMGGTIHQVLEDYVFPGDPLFPEEVLRSIAELGGDGLIDAPALSSMMSSGAALLHPRVKPYGARYLRFLEASDDAAEAGLDAASSSP